LKAVIERLDDGLDTKFLNNIDNLDDVQLGKLDNYYKNMPPPGKTQGDFIHKAGGYEVYYDKFGHPNFKDFCPGKKFCFKTEKLTGIGNGLDLHPDFDMFAKNLQSRGIEIDVRHSTGSPILIKIDGKWEGPFTLHHHQDGKTIMPVKQEVHNKIAKHSGGAATAKSDLKGVFDSPY
jgi:hypothetical protein